MTYDPSSLETLTVEMDGHVAWVTLNRPKIMNSLNSPNGYARKLLCNVERQES